MSRTARLTRGVPPPEAKERERHRRAAYARRRYRADPEQARSRAREEYKRNSARAIARARAYREENLSAIQARQQRYREENRDRLRMKARARYAANRERTIAAVAEYARTLRGKEVQAATQRRRKARKLGGEEIVPLIVLERDDGICGICGADVDPLSFEVDHVIPLARGGGHLYANVQVAHPLCNRRKSTKAQKGVMPTHVSDSATYSRRSAA